MNGLDFEKPILELERKIEELKSFTSGKKIDLKSEIKKLEDKLTELRKEELVFSTGCKDLDRILAAVSYTHLTLPTN